MRYRLPDPAGSAGIEQARLPPHLQTELTSRGILTLESLYGLMVGAPQHARPLFESFGLDFGAQLATIRALLPADVVRELERPAEGPFPTGVRIRTSS